jgi:hypothetical protein
VDVDTSHSRRACRSRPAHVWIIPWRCGSSDPPVSSARTGSRRAPVSLGSRSASEARLQLALNRRGLDRPLGSDPGHLPAGARPRKQRCRESSFWGNVRSRSRLPDPSPQSPGSRYRREGIGHVCVGSAHLPRPVLSRVDDRRTRAGGRGRRPRRAGSALLAGPRIMVHHYFGCGRCDRCP